jgi:hypothetical protein
MLMRPSGLLENSRYNDGKMDVTVETFPRLTKQKQEEIC